MTKYNFLKTVFIKEKQIKMNLQMYQNKDTKVSTVFLMKRFLVSALKNRYDLFCVLAQKAATSMQMEPGKQRNVDLQFDFGMLKMHV